MQAGAAKQDKALLVLPPILGDFVGKTGAKTFLRKSNYFAHDAAEF
jgi:hypothetical protein